MDPSTLSLHRATRDAGHPPRHFVGIRPRDLTVTLLPQWLHVIDSGRGMMTTSRRSWLRSITRPGSARHVRQYVGGGGIGVASNVVPHSQQAARSCIAIPSMYRRAWRTDADAAGSLGTLVGRILRISP